MPNVQLSAVNGQALGAALQASNAIQASTNGSITVNETAFLSAAKTVLPDAQAQALLAQVKGYALHGGAVFTMDNPQVPNVIVPWDAMAQTVQSGDGPAALMAAGLGVHTAGNAQQISQIIRTKLPNAPASFLNDGVLTKLGAAGASFSSHLPMPRLSPTDITKLAQTLMRAQFGPWEGHWWGWAIGFQITFNHDDAAFLAGLLNGTDGAATLIAAAKAAATAGVGGAITAVVGVLTASAAGAMAAIAFALGENMALVNNKWGVSIECNWPYTGGLFFWAQGADQGPTVTLTSPAVNARLTGAVSLQANSVAVSGVGFSANYSDHAGAAPTWHSLGNGRLASTTGNTSLWTLVFDTRLIPNQSNVNICALALTDEGNPGDVKIRDYHLVTVANTAPVNTTPTLIAAGLAIHTNDDDKHDDTSFTISVTTANGQTVLAGLGHEAYSTNGSTTYTTGSDHTLALNLNGTPAASQCQNFMVKMSQQVNGHDTWKFNATVTLHFSDGSQLYKTWNGIQLVNNHTFTF